MHRGLGYDAAVERPHEGKASSFRGAYCTSVEAPSADSRAAPECVFGSPRNAFFDAAVVVSAAAVRSGAMLSAAVEENAYQSFPSRFRFQSNADSHFELGHWSRRPYCDSVVLSICYPNSRPAMLAVARSLLRLMDRQRTDCLLESVGD